MSDEEDYSRLPIEDRLVHKVWKARKQAYEELDRSFQAQSPQAFEIWKSHPDLVVACVSDSNVVSQEAALAALDSFLKYGGKPAVQNTADVVAALCDKGLSSSRAGTKKKVIDALQWYVELGDPQSVIEQVIPSLSARSPKTIASATSALDEIYKSFGCQTCAPQLVLDQLPKLFAHADRHVRVEAIKLSVTLRSFLGEAFDQLVFPKLKPIQQKDLTKEFAKINGVAQPTRGVGAGAAGAGIAGAGIAGGSSARTNTTTDIFMSDAPTETATQPAAAASAPTPAIDAWDIATPVDVDVPSNFYQEIDNPKWKERVAALEDLKQRFNVVKLSNADYIDLVRVLGKCISSDANVQAVTLAAEILVEIANGSHSFPYVSMVIGSLLERTKEKKRSVVVALNNALDACYHYSSFSEICGTCIHYMSNRVPQVKIESCQYMMRCLQEPPSQSQTDSIFETAIKLLEDPQVQVRNAASEVIASMMRVLGERASQPYLMQVDGRHMQKIQQYYSKGPSAKAPKPQLQPQTIPAKRAGSPVRRVSGPRQASRQMPRQVSDSSKLTSRPLHAADSHDPSDRRKIENLQAEKRQWDSERAELEARVNELTQINRENEKTIKSLTESLDDYKGKYTVLSVAAKSKDTQLRRLQSDLDAYKNRIAALEHTKGSDKLEPLQKNEGELNRRISILSIESEKENKLTYEVDTSDESWKHAEEVTNQLRARIEQMKARTRSLEQH